MNPTPSYRPKLPPPPKLPSLSNTRITNLTPYDMNEIKEFMTAARSFADSQLWSVQTSERNGTATMTTPHGAIYQEELSEVESWAQSHNAKYSVIAKGDRIAIQVIHVPEPLRHGAY